MNPLKFGLCSAALSAFAGALIVGCGGSGTDHTEPSLPSAINETETNANGFTATAAWKRNGHSMTYAGTADNGAVETLTVTEWNTRSSGVVIDRSDLSGSSKGLTAKYVGSLGASGSSVSGTVEWKSPGFDTLGTWSATW
jgi:hypothetical protein